MEKFISEKKSCAGRSSRQGGFTLIEILIYAVVFGVSSVFLVAILTTVTRTQLRQSSVNEVNQQLSFAADTLQRLVRESSAVEIDSGTATSTLILRMASSSTDKTFVYASGTTLYLEQGSSTIGAVPPIFLTNNKVNITNFSATKYENPGGLALVQFDITIEASTSNPLGAASRVWRGAVSRVTAATFDSAILPNANSNYDVGNSTYNWKDAYFAESIGVGASPLSGSTKGVKSGGDIVLTTSTIGLVLMKSDGTCVRLTVNSSGNIATTSLSCP